MAQINPYINFNGNAEEAFTFYKSVFGGEFGKIVRFKDLSSAEFPVPEKEANKIMRIVLPIGNTVLIANDVPEVMGRVNENENRSKIAITAESRAEAEKLFKGLSEGGSVEMPMGESPWGSTFAMFRDKYGIEWTVEFSPEKWWSQVELSKFHTPTAVKSEPQNAPSNTLGLRRIMFTVTHIGELVARLCSKHGAKLVGEIAQYEDSYRLCFLRGPEGILVGLAEELNKE